jgi:hypothetical protein
MDEPTGPPMMPAAGWYLDPDANDTWRYWDGARWTEHRAPVNRRVRRDPHSFSAWFDESVAAVRAVLWPVGAVVAGLWLVAAIPFVVIVVWAFDSSDGREVRDVLDVGWNGTTSELTDAEADRVVELMGDIAWRALPWLVVAAVLTAAVAAWTYAMVARSASSRVDGAEGSDALMVGALRRVLPLLGSVLVLSALFVGIAALLLGPMLVLVVVDTGEVAIALAAVFGAIASLVVSVVVGVRLSLAPVIAALGGHGLGIRRSWDLTDGHGWGVLGRQVVAILLASALSGVVGFGIGFSLFLGLVAFAVITTLFQVVSNAVNTVVVTPAQVVLVRHLEEQHGERLERP